MSRSTTPPGVRYLEEAGRLIERLATDEWPNIRAGAQLLAETLERGHVIHAFGTGHSHMLAEELFYRAGGLVQVRPILFDGLMLHAGARISTSLERLPELASALLDAHPMAEGDALIVASNSGGNAVVSTLARLAEDGGVRTIAIMSRAHATSPAARKTGVPRLHEIASVVIDNGGCVGDAAIEIEGFATRVAPTSTVVGAAILNAMVAEAVQLLVARGVSPEVFLSANLEGGDAANAARMPEGAAR